MNWVVSAFGAMFSAVPIFLLAGVAERHAGVSSHITAMLWSGCAGIGIAGYLIYIGRGHEIVAISPMWVVIFLVGLVLGTTANILLFHSLTNAPNPGLGAAIFNASALPTFVASALLALLLPRYFEAGSFSTVNLMGVFLIVGGLWLINLKND